MVTWSLEDYDWDPETGVATLIYERVREDTGETVTRIETRNHPTSPKHVGWKEWLAGQN